MARTNRWDELFQRFKNFENDRKKDERSKAEAEQALREFEAWCAKATDQVMADIARTAQQRAVDFEDHTGRTVKVRYPSHEAIGLGRGGPYMTFARLSLDDSHVHIYSYRGSGSLPAIHLLHTHEERLPRHRRLVSQPGCFVARRPDDGYELRNVRKDDEEATPTTVDDLVFQAYDLLVQTVRKPPHRDES